MRRVVTMLVLVMVAMSLTACGGSPAPTESTGTPAAPTAGVPASPAAANANAVAPTGDTLSPTQTVTPGEMFPTDKTAVPASVLTALAKKKALLVMWLDSSTKVATDQRREVNRIIKKYKGTINLVSLKYTRGLTSSTTSTTLEPETQKLELLASSLKLNTTPYILFVDRYGRITYRFAGFADRKLLEREILRATE